jgi:hypothetical protein
MTNNQQPLNEASLNHAPNSQQPNVMKWVAIVGLVNAALLALLFLPVAPIVSAILLALVAAVVGIAAGWGKVNPLRVAVWTFKGTKRLVFGRTPSLERTVAAPRVSLWLLLLYAAEIAFVSGAAIYVTGQEHYVERAAGKLRGVEAEYLTSSAYFAALSLREYGYIPKWQTWLEWGEPLMTSPFSFVVNPISAGPSLLFGGLQGIRMSVVLYGIVAAVGGWFLARVLGCGTLARVLLGLLLLGKGNMQAMIGMGFFQLGVSQAYFPWVIGGTLAILWLPGKRWPVVLTALSFTLMFWAGNVWYTLPVLLSMAILVILYAWLIPGRIDWAVLRRLALAGALTIGLSAVTLLSLVAEQGYIGDHPDQVEAGDVVALDEILPMFVDNNMERLIHIYPPEKAPDEYPMSEVALTYYSYVSPFWFLVLIFIAIPPIWPYLHRPGRAHSGGIWLAGALMMLICVLWGAGGNPIFVWLYEHVPLLGQWRFVGRALALASFWLAVLMALRVDGLWRAVSYYLSTQQGLNRQDAEDAKGESNQQSAVSRQQDLNHQDTGRVVTAPQNTKSSPMQSPPQTSHGRVTDPPLQAALLPLSTQWRGGRGVRMFSTQNLALLIFKLSLAGFLVVLTAASLVVAQEVNQQWGYVPGFDPPSYRDDICLRWLRERHPDAQLMTYRGGYDAIYAYFQRKVRKFNVEVDYTALPMPNTIGNLSLLRYESLPQYAITWVDRERQFFKDNGFAPLAETQLIDENYCLWYNPNALSFAYTVPLSFYEHLDVYAGDKLLAGDTLPVTTMARMPDDVALIVQAHSDEPLILTVQELAYPGWQVMLDGQSVPLEVAGGQIAALIPPDGKLHQVHFMFRPPLFYLGAWVTLATALVCVGYLLRGERLLVVGR